MSIGKIEAVGRVVPRGRATGEGTAVVHGDEEPGIIDGELVFIEDKPEAAGAGGGDFTFADESAEAVSALVVFHVAAAHPGVHRIAADAR